MAMQFIANRSRSRPVARGQAGHRELGQAMTEFYVMLVGFMVPLFMFIPVLGQISSIRQDAESAVRYSAWQRTVWKGTNAEIDSNFQATEAASAPGTVKSDDQIAREVDSRIFASGDSPIYTSMAGNPTIELKPFNTTVLGAPSGQLISLIDQRAGSTPASPRYATQTSSDVALAGTEGNLIATGLSRFSGLRFEMNDKGLVTANVNFNLIQLPTWLWPSAMSGSPLSMGRKLSLYTDAWTPGGRRDERYRIAGLVLEELNLDTPSIHNLQNRFSPTIAKIIRCNSYESDCYLDFGYTNVDAVPSTRLTN